MSVSSQNTVLSESDSTVITTFSKMLSSKRQITVETGETPFTFNDTQKFFYFILSGKIKISQINTETSKEQTTQLLTRGDMFDVVTLLDGEFHEYIATALETTQMIQVPIASVRERIDNDPEFNRFFFPYLGKQMRNLENLAVDLSLYDVYQRLLRLIARNVQHTEDGLELHLINDLSHEELAALVGTVRKVLNRNLQKLKQDGIVNIERKKLTLRDIEALFDALEY